MIQRLQSVYLLLAIVCLAAVLGADALNVSRAAQTWAWFPGAAYLLAVGGIAACGIAIVLFRDRAMQLRVASGAVLLCLLLAFLFVVGFVVSGDLGAWLAEGHALALALPALPVLALVFASLGRRAIARDIALVRSMDRLR